jgi:hypothetical protein
MTTAAAAVQEILLETLNSASLVVNVYRWQPMEEE